MEFSVRRAKSGDEPVLRELRLEAMKDSPEAFGSTYERETARTTQDWQKWLAPGVTYLLEVDGRARGLVAGIRDGTEENVVHLMAMWVHPDFRGKGRADMLVRSVKEWADEVRAAEVRLYVVEQNVPARRCYERNGFRATGRQGVLERNGNIEIEMMWEVSHL
jgi:GNAT superfamily N-acetyltransferase